MLLSRRRPTHLSLHQPGCKNAPRHVAPRITANTLFFLSSLQFGTVETNWVGNFVDLIIHRKNSGWDYATARKNVDVFTGKEYCKLTKPLS